MNEVGLFLYPWDLAGEGINHVLDFAANAGCTTLYLASVYHAGLLLEPHNPRHKVHLLEDGVAFFHPRMELYGEIRPRVAQIARDVDWFAAVAARLEEFGLRLSAWTVCMHNSRLGEEHPNAVVQDAFGTRRPYALCPSHPEVRQYMRALVRDLARYPVASLLLEAFRYMDVVHGAHHERWSIPLTPLERTLLSLSFTDTDLAAAERAGVNAHNVREAVRRHLETFFDTYPAVAPDLPRTLDAFVERNPELSSYVRCLQNVMNGLLDEVLENLRGTEVALVGQGQQDFNITCHPEKRGFEAVLRAVYDQKPDEAGATVRKARSSLLPGQKLYVGVKLGFGAIADAAQLRSTVVAVRDAGADGVLFYNYAECARVILGWIAPAVASAAIEPRV